MIKGPFKMYSISDVNSKTLTISPSIAFSGGQISGQEPPQSIPVSSPFLTPSSQEITLTISTLLSSQLKKS